MALKSDFLTALLVTLAFLVGIDDSRAAGAGKDTEVVWYTAMNTSDAEAVRKLFHVKYPSVDLTVLRQPGEKIRTRILTEMRAGRFFWDVVSFNHLDMDALNQEGLLAAYASPEATSGFPPGAVDKDGRWASIYVRQYVIGYNTNLVSAADAPKHWQDLLQPRWRGKISMDEGDVEWYAAMLDYMGRDNGMSFMRALAGQKPQFRRGHTLLSKLLVAGDFPLALVHAAEMEEAKKSGAPVEWVKTLDPVITSPSQVGISARAPHARAARLLVDVLLSREGQALMLERGRVPARIDLARDGSSAPALKVHYVDARLSRRYSEYEKEYREIFLGGR